MWANFSPSLRLRAVLFQSDSRIYRLVAENDKEIANVSVPLSMSNHLRTHSPLLNNWLVQAQSAPDMGWIIPANQKVDFPRSLVE